MSLKVTFTDTSKTQYDANADLIKIKFKSITGGKAGKLFLGDRWAASFLQLRSRNCKHVVNCDKNIHSLSREDDIKYCNVDPTEGKSDALQEAHSFIETELAQGNNVTVLCETGNNKSATIVAYFIMKCLGLTHTAAIDHLKQYRSRIRIKDELLSLLFKEERKLKVTSKNGKSGGQFPWAVVLGVLAFFGALFAIFFMVVGKV